MAPRVVYRIVLYGLSARLFAPRCFVRDGGSWSHGARWARVYSLTAVGRWSGWRSARESAPRSMPRPTSHHAIARMIARRKVCDGVMRNGRSWGDSKRSIRRIIGLACWGASKETSHPPLFQSPSNGERRGVSPTCVGIRHVGLTPRRSPSVMPTPSRGHVGPHPGRGRHAHAEPWAWHPVWLYHNDSQ